MDNGFSRVQNLELRLAVRPQGGWISKTKIALAIRRYQDIPYDTIHIATERKSVFELASRRRPDVRPPCGE